LAMQMYGDENNELLPMAHDSVAWTNTSPAPWTAPLLPFFHNTNVLQCPSMMQYYSHSPFSYFMGSRAAYLEAGEKQASVDFRKIQNPSAYILSGDCNFDFGKTDADPDNYTQDTLFAFPKPPGHGGRVNVLFGDMHVKSYTKFSSNE